MKPRETLFAFDRYLAERALRFEGVVIGGAALYLLGVVMRPTRDCDILHPELPEEIRAAARAFAAAMRWEGEALEDDWLNNGPAALAKQLPEAWEKHVQTVFSGVALQLQSLGREDLLRAKLFALCDRGLDLADCLALAPAADELAALLPWLDEQDLNRDWPAHVRATLADLGRRLGHAV
ncbi:MAG TPA: DUF6036 family nucleotidyltransferase [Thermoanaerobaculia bacterium]|nr:DUF6036 family nucleotidyltransferase [Thermoanaerobaculia bacterium]